VVAEPSPPERKGEERRGEEKKDNRAANAALNADFKIWYQVFPLHLAPGDAERAYMRARKIADAETLLAAARAYAAKPDRDPKFTKHPATWLNKKCWLDETPSVAPTTLAPDPERIMRDKASMVARGIRSTRTTISDSEIAHMIKNGLVSEGQARAYGWIPSTEFVPTASSNARVA
jgi:hypothetical protein